MSRMWGNKKIPRGNDDDDDDDDKGDQRGEKIGVLFQSYFRPKKAEMIELLWARDEAAAATVGHLSDLISKVMGLNLHNKLFASLFFGNAPEPH